MPYKAMICSVGTATPTSGTYTISDKYVWRLLEGDVYGQYASRITGSILFHSVPYIEQDKSTLEWWEYDKLGQKASLGCVRLTVEDAKWIYANCVAGTKVEFYSSSNPGPLGKPKAQKISNDSKVRNWDPTDPDSDNPWKSYTRNENNGVNQNLTNTTNTTNGTSTNTTNTNNTVTNNSNTTQNNVTNTTTDDVTNTTSGNNTVNNEEETTNTKTSNVQVVG